MCLFTLACAYTATKSLYKFVWKCFAFIKSLAQASAAAAFYGQMNNPLGWDKGFVLEGIDKIYQVFCAIAKIVNTTIGVKYIIGTVILAHACY